MKKFILFSIFSFLCIGAADAYQVLSSKELGTADAKNQNVVVKCTTDMGKVSNQTCSLRRYVKCSADKKNCSGWQAWKSLSDPSRDYSDWRSAAESCCRAKGLR